VRLPRYTRAGTSLRCSTTQTSYRSRRGASGEGSADEGTEFAIQSPGSLSRDPKIQDLNIPLGFSSHRVSVLSNLVVSIVSLPEGLDGLLVGLNAIEARRGELPPKQWALCHNDLFGGNILDGDAVRIIDWEFVGMRDIFFDLATLAIACDEFDPSPGERSEIIVDAYFGEVIDAHRQRIRDMIFVVQMHNGAWGLTHHLLGTQAHGWEGLTHLGFAAELIDHLLGSKAD